MKTPRIYTYYDCKMQGGVFPGHRTDGACHHCKEIIHLVEVGAVTAEGKFEKTDSPPADQTELVETLIRQRDNYKREVEAGNIAVKAMSDQIAELEAEVQRLKTEGECVSSHEYLDTVTKYSDVVKELVPLRSAFNRRTEAEKKIVEYCRHHVETMWAATIIGYLLDEDFRNVANAIAKWDAAQKKKGEQCTTA